MTNYREQAIRDVAAAINYSEDFLRLLLEYPPVDVADRRICYTVAQRERALKLEAALRSTMQIHSHEREANGFSECYDLASLALDMQLQQKEGKRG